MEEKFVFRRVKEKDVKRAEIFRLVKEGIITLKHAGLEIDLSYRQTIRLYKRYKRGGLQGIAFHRNHSPSNKTPSEVRKRVVEMQKMRSDYNLSHLYDYFKAKYEDADISYSTFRRILIEKYCYAPCIKRRKPRKRFEMEKAGQLLQMDTSRHKWIPGIDRYFSLIMIIDDHSRYILDARIVEQDTTWNNMLALRSVVEKYGTFEALYVDRDSKFKYTRNNPSMYFNYKSDPDSVHTQIDKALTELSIKLLHAPAFDPQSKGKVERPFGFLQDRLIKEFRDNGIRDLESANRYLEKWIKWNNEERIHTTTKCRPVERLTNSCFQHCSGWDLDDVFCIRDKRKVNSDNTFPCNGKVFQITENTYRLSWYKAEVELHILPKEKIRVFYKDRFVQEFAYDGD